jgi:hypothetical protein
MIMPVVAFILTLMLVGPAFGQQTRTGDDVQYRAVCQNIIGAISVVQSQEGNAGAAAVGGDATDTNGGGDAEAVAQVAQAQGVSVAQVNECLNEAGAGERPGANAAKDQYAKANVIAATIPKKPLPFTGGIPLHGLFAVLGLAAIVAGVFVLRAVMSRRP